MNKNKTKTKVPKYQFGTLIENPASTLYENQIALAKASEKADKNGWAQGFQIFGNLAQQVGTSIMNKGVAKGDGADGKGLDGFLNKNNGDVQSGLNMMSAFSQFLAMGGTVPGTPVEVEGNEVGQTPNGEVMEFKGPSHEDGGIPISLPEGTEIYSKRIKIDGVSMADRKKKREKKSMTLESLFEKNKTDALLKNSIKRTNENNTQEEETDNKIQMVIKQLLDRQENKVEKHAFGNIVGDPIKTPKGIKYGDPDPGNPADPYHYMTSEDLLSKAQNFLTENAIEGGKNNKQTSIAFDKIDKYFNKDIIGDNASLDGMGVTDQKQSFEDFSKNMNRTIETEGTNKNSNELLGGMTLGDATGLAGNLISTFGPMANTKANRAGDTPNINAFEDYGKKGLDTLDTSKQYVNQVREQALKDLQLARTASVKRNNNSSRSVNTSRALNLATDAGINNAEEQTYNSFAQQMMAILGQQAGMENQQDQVVMTGEQNRDLADRQDRDNYFSQLAQDIATKGFGLQETGKDINSIKERQVIQNLLNQLSMYGITVDSKGNLSNPTKKE